VTAGRISVSKNKDWCTPQKYVEAVHRFFGGLPELDPCSNLWSTVGASTEYRLPDNDGLKCSWFFPTIYVNPPYGVDRERKTKIGDWLQRCSLAHQKYGSEVLALIPVATNTRHWKDFVWGSAAAIAFLGDTRLKFIIPGAGAGKGAPMACAMVYWGCHVPRFRYVFSHHGTVVELRKLTCP